MNEEWRDILGYEGSYQVSDQGRVRSLDRMTIDKNGIKNHFKGKILKPILKNPGYFQVIFSPGLKHSRIHTLVLTAFVGPCPTGLECCHNDGNQLNNRIDNLRWDTRSANRLDTLKQGKCHLAKLSEQSVLWIRKNKNITTQMMMAKKFGVAVSTISRIITGKAWAYLLSENQ